MTTAKTHVVHGLPPMTTAELAAIACGHCRHRLTMHVTQESGSTFCAICHCTRRASEGIRKPHNFTDGAA
jgi:uncharacterized CHY-type Zn-finger protein